VRGGWLTAVFLSVLFIQIVFVEDSSCDFFAIVVVLVFVTVKFS
jgi:hypothetical protein